MCQVRSPHRSLGATCQGNKLPRVSTSNAPRFILSRGWVVSAPTRWPSRPTDGIGIKKCSGALALKNRGLSVCNWDLRGSGTLASRKPFFLSDFLGKNRGGPGGGGSHPTDQRRSKLSSNRPTRCKKNSQQANKENQV